MRLNKEEKAEIIRLMENGPNSMKQSLKDLGNHNTTFYNCYGAYKDYSVDGL